jgi:hypothetical protein
VVTITVLVVIVIFLAHNLGLDGLLSSRMVSAVL